MRAIALAAIIAALFAPCTARAQTTTLSLDVSGSWVFVAFDRPGGVVDVTDPANSADWDIAFQGTDVMLNGESAGPGNVAAICLCRNQLASNDDLQRMTPESELPEFEAVTGEAIPADADWNVATFGAFPWFRYDILGGHRVWPNYNVYLVRRGDTVYKLQLIGYYDAIGTPRRLTLRYARVVG